MGFCPEIFEHILSQYILTLSALIVNSGVLVLHLEIFILEIALNVDNQFKKIMKYINIFN